MTLLAAERSPPTPTPTPSAAAQILVFGQRDSNAQELYTNCHPVQANTLSHSSAFDLFITRDIVVPCHARAFPIDLEIVVLVSSTLSQYRHSPFWIIQKTFVASTPLRMSNAIELNNGGFWNQTSLKVPVDNLDDNECHIKKGSMLFQIVHSLAQPYCWHYYDESQFDDRFQLQL
jgi:hypothetical protein